MRTVYYSLYLPVTFKTLIYCDLFNTVSCLNFLGHLSIAASTSIGAWFIEESVVSSSVFNLGFFHCWASEWWEKGRHYICGLTCRVTRRRGGFLGGDLCFLMSLWLFQLLSNFVLIFANKFTCNQKKWRLLYGNFKPVPVICVMEIPKVFRVFAQHFIW